MASSAVFLLFALVVMIAGAPLASDNDVYFHLAAGKKVWETGAPLLHDVFTYTAYGRPDEAWHSWLAQLIFFGVHRLAGANGLFTLNYFLVAITLICALRFTWRRTGSQSATLIAGTLVLLVHHHVQVVRPLLFGETLFAITVFEILPWGRDLTRRRLLAGIVVGGLWANLHGSAVIYPVLFAVHALTRWRTPGLSWAGPAFALLSTCLGPKGPGLYPYALELSRLGKIAGDWEWAGAWPVEWKRSFAETPVLRVHLDVPSLVIISCIAWLFAARASLQSPEIIPFVFLPLLSARHSVYLIFPAAVLAARFLSQLPKAGAWALSITLLASFRFYQSYDVTPSIEKATDFLAEARIEGNVLCDPAWSNYLTYRLHPSIKVAYDTRTLLHSDFYRRARLLYDEYGKEAWSLIQENPPPGTQILMTSSWGESPNPKKWKVIFQNNHAVIAISRSEHGLLSRFSTPLKSKQMETNDWGRWPEPAAVEAWKRKQRKFYEKLTTDYKDLG